MAIKRIGQTPDPEPEKKPQIKRVTKAESSSGDFVTKEELVGKLVLLTLNDFDPRYVGQYNPTEKVDVDVLVVESGAKHAGTWWFGNLAKQIGDGLEVGETGLGTVASGPTKNGGTWFGFEWSESDSDYELAEAALADATETIPY